jgi:hypothetical protein
MPSLLKAALRAAHFGGHRLLPDLSTEVMNDSYRASVHCPPFLVFSELDFLEVEVEAARRFFGRDEAIYCPRRWNPPFFCFIPPRSVDWIVSTSIIGVESDSVASSCLTSNVAP